MSANESARKEMLGRVRAALGKPTAGHLAAREFSQPSAGGAAAGGARRPAPDEATVERFVARVNDYQAHAQRVLWQELGAELDRVCAEHGAARIALAPGLWHAWHQPENVSVVLHEGTDATSLDEVDGACTGCQIAIAETGTFVLDGGPLSGPRILSLIPDLHICVVETSQIVADVPEALNLLDPTKPLTWISGPSATSDIELDRVEGVHGPRSLEVLVVG